MGNETLTSWRFMGVAHTPGMAFGLLEDETVAQKLNDADYKFFIDYTY